MQIYININGTNLFFHCRIMRQGSETLKDEIKAQIIDGSTDVCGGTKGT